MTDSERNSGVPAPQTPPTILPVFSEATRAALDAMPWDAIAADVGEAMAREKEANPTLVGVVVQAIGPQLHVLKEDNPLLTDDELGNKMAGGAAALTLYLLARQAGIDEVDLSTGIMDPEPSDS